MAKAVDSIRGPMRLHISGFGLAIACGNAQYQPGITEPHVHSAPFYAEASRFERGARGLLLRQACQELRTSNTQDGVEDVSDDEDAGVGEARVRGEVEFFEQKLRVAPKIYLAVLDREHWPDAVFGGTPYGLPNSTTSRSGVRLVCLAATHDAFDELGRNIKASLPIGTLKAIESSGLSFEQGMREFGDSLMTRELGHLYATAYGISPPNRWVDELLANYLATAYTSEQPAAPQFENFLGMLSAGSINGPRPKHTTLDDFERLYSGVGVDNYGWYQWQITRRGEDVYKTKKLDFLKEVKAAFPPSEKRPIAVDVSLERLEKIAPGFLDWARELAGGAR